MAVLCAFTAAQVPHAQSGPSVSESQPGDSGLGTGGLARTAPDTLSLTSANTAGPTISQLHAFLRAGQPIPADQLRLRQVDPGHYRIQDGGSAPVDLTFRLLDRGMLYRVRQHTGEPAGNSDEEILRRARQSPAQAAGMRDLPVLLSSSGYALVLSDAAFRRSASGLNGADPDVTITLPAEHVRFDVVIGNTLEAVLQRVKDAVPDSGSPASWDIDPLHPLALDDGPSLRARIFTPELDYALYPYRVLSEREASIAGEPAMEPLTFEEQVDLNSTWAEDQYRFGKSMIVAPGGTAAGPKTLVLPAGSWVNLWTGSQVVGNLPVRWERPNGEPVIWVRGGTVLTTLPVVRDEAVLLAGAAPTDRRRDFVIFPGLDNEFSLTTTDFEGRTLSHTQQAMTIQGGSDADARVRWRYRQPRHVLVNGASLPLHNDPDGSFIDFHYADHASITWNNSTEPVAAPVRTARQSRRRRS